MDYNKIFSDFVLLDSSIDILNKYLTKLDISDKEKFKRIFMIREIAKKKLTTSILDDEKVTALIREVTNIYDVKKTIQKTTNRSFNDVFFDDGVTSFDQDLIRYKFIYANSIIYVDAIKDIPHNTVLSQHSQENKFSSALDKPKIFLNHFNIMKHFLLRNPNFKTKFQNIPEGIEITTLDSLQGNANECCVLGMLAYNEAGRAQLQDNHKLINLDLSETEWGKGYYTPGCVVLAQGFYKNDMFRAKVICHPPLAENNSTFQEKFMNDFFGSITKAFRDDTDNNMNRAKSNKLNKPEESFLINFLNKDGNAPKIMYPKIQENHIHLNYENFNMSKATLNLELAEKFINQSEEFLSEEFILVISNPDLSNQNVINAIEKIVTSYNTGIVPLMIVFMGNFINEKSYNAFKTYTTLFDNLALALNKNSAIVKNTYIVLIPGPDDFSLFSGFPKHPLIDNIVNNLKKKIPNLISASNPAKFSIFGKEFVFFRDDLNKKLSKNSIVKCTDISKNTESFIHTILCQGNLAPVDLSVTSRIWHLSDSMMMLPLPDTLVLADVVLEFNDKKGKTRIVNPGNFTKDFSFTIINPIRNEAELVKINI